MSILLLPISAMEEKNTTDDVNCVGDETDDDNVTDDETDKHDGNEHFLSADSCVDDEIDDNDKTAMTLYLCWVYCLNLYGTLALVE